MCFPHIGAGAGHQRPDQRRGRDPGDDAHSRHSARQRGRAACRSSGLMADQRIKPGEKVLTAGGDLIFPRGLPVGVVREGGRRIRTATRSSTSS